ncbi:hypothetical protein QWY75_08835 [Pontixanthobacter aestiaquae]|uniref:Prokaryotic glutathione synthetase ATP-binding domain-containing protein n=1 Tax=Pontixanthobacter aestiaquae TaxID=1509367 RepID=A0A844Z626_9SPHN|nr:hypothetical protein [Pontixanthobacter aestiaquae]MDN3646303.1 hypothetical protein [Pontixanthobacter aestiaquae]MXO82706.1 hypothetical protein [Pontixanthobacter aestiaquae]
MKIGFLACPGTMPPASAATGAKRRGDAYEHDLQVAALRPALEERGGSLTEIDWHSPLEDCVRFDLVLLGTVWDYQDHADSFLAKIEAIAASGVMVCNAPELVRWNIDKIYLKELAENGALTIPTVWSDNPGYADIAGAFDHFECDRVVAKLRVSGGAEGQHSFSRDHMPARDWRMGGGAMIQPFLPAIQEEGELSFIFIDGAFSHAILKTAATGEYRIQSLYGGQETQITPSDSDIAAALSVLSSLPGDTPLYARIDMLRADGGGLMVMEAEVIEPFLYPVQGPDLGARMAEAIAARLK